MAEPPQYELLEKIGNGAFGEVHRARHARSGRVVAIKRLRVSDGDGSRRLQMLPAAHFQEIEALRQLEHPNLTAEGSLWLQIVKLWDVFADGAYLSLVFEFIETDLFSIIRQRQERFEAPDARGLMRMLLHAVAHCHAKSIVHRDLKPGNLLVDANGILKLSDFGLATVFVGKQKSYSHQVATRWYRAPELLFGSRNYDCAIDMWAVGAIFAELLRTVPLFPGQNDIDQLYRVIQVLGNPELEQWTDARELPDYDKVSFPPYKKIPFANLFPDASRNEVDLLEKLLVLDPKKRISARQALMHPFFFDGAVHSRFLPLKNQKNIDSTSSRFPEDEGTDGHDHETTSTTVTTIDEPLDSFLASLGKPLILTKSL